MITSFSERRLFAFSSSSEFSLKVDCFRQTITHVIIMEFNTQKYKNWTYGNLGQKSSFNFTKTKVTTKQIK
jgi:hypothetical protein